MDKTDKRILEILSKKADATATQIGLEVNLSVPAVNKRILKMQNDGTINHYTIITDPEKMGKTITAFVFVVIEYGENIKELIKYAIEDADVLECYSVTGEYDYILKICAKDLKTLEDKILRIKKTKGVTKSHTVISLMEHKFTPTVLPDTEE